MTTKEKKAIENLLSAWETIPPGKYYSPADLQEWVIKNINPDLLTLKNMLKKSSEDK